MKGKGCINHGSALLCSLQPSVGARTFSGGAWRLTIQDTGSERQEKLIAQLVQTLGGF